MFMAPWQVKALLVIASHLSGYPIPADAPLPQVQEVTAAQMSKDACPGASVLECPVIGFFDFATSDIEVVNDQAYTGHSINGIAVHELTHWLQFHNWDNPSNQDCPRELRRESEAYRAGTMYEVQYDGSSADSFETPGVLCSLPTK